MWLEMARNPVQGPGEWSFGQALWSPSTKKGGARWPYWELLKLVREGDTVVHLRGKGPQAAFVGYSRAAGDGHETTWRPPDSGEYEYASSFYRVPLDGYSAFETPQPLQRILNRNEAGFRSYIAQNRALPAHSRKSIFCVTQGGRLQCQNGAYLSQLDSELVHLDLDDAVQAAGAKETEHDPRSVVTGQQARSILDRVGQRNFSRAVRDNYGSRCCFPGCDVAEDRLLVGAHIVRWADDPGMRGDVSNGICLCLMHDKSFELGWWTVDLSLRIFVDPALGDVSDWARARVAPWAGSQIRLPLVPPSPQAIQGHWQRTNLQPSGEESIPRTA